MTPAAIDELLEKLNRFAADWDNECGLPLLHGPALDELRSIVAQWAAGQSQWQDIATAPKDGTVILLYRYIDPWHVKGFGHWEGDTRAFVSGWISYGFNDPPGNLGLAAPSHWMPIPKVHP